VGKQVGVHPKGGREGGEGNRQLAYKWMEIYFQLAPDTLKRRLIARVYPKEGGGGGWGEPRVPSTAARGTSHIFNLNSDVASSLEMRSCTKGRRRKQWLSKWGFTPREGGRGGRQLAV